MEVAYLRNTSIFGVNGHSYLSPISKERFGTRSCRVSVVRSKSFGRNKGTLCGNQDCGVLLLQDSIASTSCQASYQNLCKKYLKSFTQSSYGGDRKELNLGSRHVCKASMEGSSGHSNSEGDEPTGNRNGDISTSSDWRAFRAKLVATEQLQNDTPVASDEKCERGTRTLGKRWAHPILKAEAGCILIATEKLDELSIFERTVIILLGAGSSKTNEGPFGLILNRPLSHSVKDLHPKHGGLLEAFGSSQVHFGGPLESDLILLFQGMDKIPGYQEVIPGVHYSASDGLGEAVKLVNGGLNSPDNFRFFFGYAGWGPGQLEREVEDGYWYVAACSTNFFVSSPSASLWEEILRLMGGDYAELSKKPKRKLY